MSERIQNQNLRRKKELLVSIPGIGKAAVAVIAELDNLEKSDYARELVAFIGLAPRLKFAFRTRHRKVNNAETYV